MSFIQRVFGRANSSALEKRSGDGGILNVPGNLWNPAIIAQVMQGGSAANSSNEFVNDFTAQSISTVYSVNKILCDNLASLPCKLYRSAGTGEKQLAIDQPLYRLLTVEANPETSSWSLFWTAVMHLNYRGNAYIEIERDPISNEPIGLWNLDPRRTEPVRLTEQGNQLAYKTNDGMPSGEYRYVLAKNMLHFAVNTWNGLVGQSPIACLREPMGLALSQQKFMGRSMVNNAVPSMALTNSSPLPMKSVDKTKAREDWEILQTGSNQRRIAVLDQGWKLEPLGFNNVDLELLASRKFTRDEIAAAYGVPSWMVGDTEKLTSASAIQLALAFIQNTIAPLCKLLETEMKRKLIAATSTAHIAFDLRERLKGDFASTLQAFSVGLQNGFYSRNDVRRELGEDPIGPEGDLYTVQINMTNLKNMVAGKPAPAIPDGTQAEFDADQDDDVNTPSLRHMKTAFLPLFRSSVQRSLNGEPVAKTFGPVLESLAELRQIDGNVELVADLLAKIETRSTKWGNDIKAAAALELNKGVRAIVFSAHEQQAKKELAVIDGE
jgi:HK97 family phage portal protein